MYVKPTHPTRTYHYQHPFTLSLSLCHLLSEVLRGSSYPFIFVRVLRFVYSHQKAEKVTKGMVDLVEMVQLMCLRDFSLLIHFVSIKYNLLWLPVCWYGGRFFLLLLHKTWGWRVRGKGRNTPPEKGEKVIRQSLVLINQYAGGKKNIWFILYEWMW